MAFGVQMRPFRMASFSVLAAFASLSLAACGEPSGPEGEAQDFSGSYTLHSISQGTTSSVTELPGATGTFTMTATTYQVSIDIPIGGAGVDDNGTYSAIGTATTGEFSQQSTDNPNLQYQGTYTWNATTNRLTLDTSAQGVRTVLVIQKT
jgi:hypothetical protein